MTVKCGILYYGKNGNQHNDTNHYVIMALTVMKIKCGIWHYGKNGNQHNDTNHYDTCNNDNQYNTV